MKPTTGFLALFVGVLAACSSGQTEVTEPTADPSASAPPEVTAVPTAAESTPPIASVAPTASAAPSYVPSGAPLTIVNGKTSAGGQVAGAGAKILLDSTKAWVKIPEGAMGTTLKVTFAVDEKGAQKAPKGMGSVYHLIAQDPPNVAAIKVTTNGPKFVVRIPNTAPKANLALGAAVTDEAGKVTVTWSVVAQKMTDDGGLQFEIGEFQDLWMQLTTEEPK